MRTSYVDGPQVRGGHDAGAEQPAARQVRGAEEAPIQAQGRHVQGFQLGQGCHVELTLATIIKKQTDCPF